MAKNKNETPTTNKKQTKTTVTGARKARRVLKSSGLVYFKEWADKASTGGSRKNGSRGAFKSDNPTLYRQLVSNGESLNRRMDVESRSLRRARAALQDSKDSSDE